ncbi:MAG: hypothetical protein IKH50_03360 [Oscillospiraceae bacterium]|nr:hypothetical protein [Oscillospiraceae bacterium]MBR6923558.1 hypothetical protein [Oscillospiraceae bacterium]
MKKEEAESTFRWLEMRSKEIKDAGIRFVCAHVITGEDPLVVVGEGDLTFYLVALVQQIKAVKKDKDIDTDKLFTMLRDMYDKIMEVDP